MNQSYPFLCQQTLNFTAGNGYLLNFTFFNNQDQQLAALIRICK